MNTTISTVEIQTTHLKKASLFFRAINHKLRQDMLRHLHREGRMSVSFLYKKMKIEQSIASQHLAILRKAGLVISERDGKLKFYSVNYQQVKQLHDIADVLLETRV